MEPAKENIPSKVMGGTVCGFLCVELSANEVPEVGEVYYKSCN